MQRFPSPAAAIWFDRLKALHTICTPNLAWELPQKVRKTSESSEVNCGSTGYVPHSSACSEAGYRLCIDREIAVNLGTKSGVNDPKSLKNKLSSDCGCLGKTGSVVVLFMNSICFPHIPQKTFTPTDCKKRCF